MKRILILFLSLWGKVKMNFLWGNLWKGSTLFSIIFSKLQTWEFLYYLKFYSVDQNSVYIITRVWLVLIATDSAQKSFINPKKQEVCKGHALGAHKVYLLYTAVPQGPWAPNTQSHAVPTLWGGWSGERKQSWACFSDENIESRGYHERALLKKKKNLSIGNTGISTFCLPFQGSFQEITAPFCLQPPR